jgi:DNA replication protein DnaC
MMKFMKTKEGECERCHAWTEVVIRTNLCWDCNDAVVIAGIEKEKEECSNYIKQNIDKILISRIGAPERIVKDLMALGDVDVPDMGGKKGLYLYGGTGSGKTTMAVEIMLRDALSCLVAKKIAAHQFSLSGVTYRFVRMADLGDRLKATFSDNAVETEWDIMSELNNASKIVLDDFGAERATDYILEKITNIIDSRYSNTLLTTIITSNYSLPQLADKLAKNNDKMIGERIISRISAMCRVVNVGGIDRRRKM